jgi:5-methylcytosine-specific restriction endonuclease McrA
VRRFTNDYNPDGKQKRDEARARAGHKCIRCGSPSVTGRILTVHHFDGNKANDEWWNLMALCQVCHLQVQGKVDPETPFFLEHSEWAKPYVAGFYAHKYEGLLLTREQTIARLDELLAHELA